VRSDSDTSRGKKRLIITAGAMLAAAITALGVLQLMPASETADPTAVAGEDVADQHATAIEVASQFLDAFTSGDAVAAGALTDDPPGATAQLTEVWRTLTPQSVSADRSALVAPPAEATTADERFTLTWDFGRDRTWGYESTLRLVRKDADWRVQWQPTLVHPRMAAGQSLQLRTFAGQPAVLDRAGGPLLTWADHGTAPADPTVAPLLLPGMDREAGSTNGWYVTLIDGTGTDLEILHGNQATALTSTLSRPVQQAAQAAVDGQQLPTMLVAIQPSTGDLLAVAQNGAAGKDPTALQGLYPLGSTFKMATATAIIEAGAADVGTVLPCPGSVTIGQRTIENEGNFALGDVPLRTAFAKSCNTTFASLAAGLRPDALAGAANQLGLGADFTIPGITTEAGGVPVSGNTAEQVENSIGQGRVQASCFGAAMMAATVAAGRAVTPRLWQDRETTVTTGYDAPPAGVISSLRTMMRDVVTSGTATELTGRGAVHGKTGTAEVGGGSAHGWFAGYRGDIAFATLVLDSTTSRTAVAVTSTFLGAVNGV
jgi:hypothetical protein